MVTFAKGYVVLFPFPYTDLSGRKLRPCLVLSDEINEDILLCQITSKNIPRDSYTVELKKSETQNGSLMIDSFIRTNMLFTATKSQIQSKVCRLPKSKYNKVIESINKLIS